MLVAVAQDVVVVDVAVVLVVVVVGFTVVVPDPPLGVWLAGNDAGVAAE
jgi:hypothetical protein